MFCCSAAGPGIGLGTVAQNIPLWLSELWTREWFSLSPASANFLLWTSQQCYCKTQYFTFIIAQRRGYFTNVATEKWQRYPLKQRIIICCGEDQRQTCLLTHVFLVINELLPCPAPTLEVHHWSGEYFHCSLWQNKWPFSFTNVKKPELLFSICLFKTHFVESFRNFNVEFFNRKINFVTTLQPSCESMTMANLQIYRVHVAQLKLICGRGSFSANLSSCETVRHYSM